MTSRAKAGLWWLPALRLRGCTMRAAGYSRERHGPLERHILFYNGRNAMLECKLRDRTMQKTDSQRV